MSIVSRFGQDVDVTGTVTSNNNIALGPNVSMNPTNITITGGGSFTLTGTEVLANAVIATDPNSAATKSFVEAVGNQLDFKESCRVKTNVALAYVAAGAGVGKTLTANPAAVLPTIDGITLIIGDRVLVDTTGSATDVDNGIYEVTQTTSPWILTRATDADEDAEVTSGMYVFINEGSNALSGFILTGADPIVVDTDPLVFTLFTGGMADVITTKGDIRIGDAGGTPDRLPVGVDNSIFVADSAQLLGARWEPNPWSMIEGTLSGESLVLKEDYFGNGELGDVIVSTPVVFEATGQEDTMAILQYNTLNVTGGGSLTLGSRRPLLVIYVLGDCTIDGTLSVDNTGANQSATKNLVFTKTELSYSLANPNPRRVSRVVNLVGGAAGTGGAIGVVGNAGTSGTSNGPEAGFATNDPFTQAAGDGLSGGGGGGGGSTTNVGGDGTAGIPFSGGSGGGGGGTTDGGDAGADAGVGGAAGTGGSGVGAGNSAAVAGIGAITNGGGGTIILIVGGNLAGSGTISAVGGAGTSDGGTAGGGGGSGGGNVVVYYGGTYTPNLLTFDVSGGAGGTSGSGGNGGVGGDGSVQGPFQIVGPSVVTSLGGTLPTVYSVTLDTSSAAIVGSGNAVAIPTWTDTTGSFIVKFTRSSGSFDAPVAFFDISKGHTSSAGSVTRLASSGNIGQGTSAQLQMVWTTGAGTPSVFINQIDGNGGNSVTYNVTVQ